VLVKEAFHHFPRPWIALHEAFRVCRKAVILIEPNDDDSHLKTWGPFRALTYSCKRLAKRLAGKPAYSHSSYAFESVGNFIYSINPQELEKFLLGMHFRFFAFTGVNDAYESGVEFVRLENPTQEDRQIIARIYKAIRNKDKRCKAGLSSFDLLIAALFKEEPPDDLKCQLSHVGWNVKELPRNPYI